MNIHKCALTLFFLIVQAGFAFSLTGIENEWGGHLKVNGSGLYYDSHSYYGQGKAEKGFDEFVDLRIKDKLSLSHRLFVEVHYDALVEGGDSHEKRAALEKQFPFFSGVFDEISGVAVNDNSLLFDFTKTIKETDHYRSIHRLDRFFVSYKDFWGNIIAGRQALTWGNGLVFNPMDLFNPFSPSDISRDYKKGNDLILLRFNSEKAGNPAFLYIPRKENNSGAVRTDQSSFAGKLHFFAEKTEIEADLLLAEHFDETIAGFGLSGTFVDAAWRSDLVYSTLNNHNDKEGFFTGIANIDYSWVVQGKNLYGLLEYYHNGLGKKESVDAFFDPKIIERLGRGEIFTLCRDYLSIQVQIETHPLFNLSVNIISNLNDDSGLIQPRGLWNMTQNTSLDFGLNKGYGKKGSEFGGIKLPGTPWYLKSPETIYINLSYYF